MDCLGCGLPFADAVEEKVINRVEETKSELINNSSLFASVPAKEPVLAPAFVCPKCKSPHLSADKQGFGLGKALVGGVLLGGVGLLGGFFGARKVTVTCMQCGHAWRAGK